MWKCHTLGIFVSFSATQSWLELQMLSTLLRHATDSAIQSVSLIIFTAIKQTEKKSGADAHFFTSMITILPLRR